MNVAMCQTHGNGVTSTTPKARRRDPANTAVAPCIPAETDETCYCHMLTQQVTVLQFFARDMHSYLCRTVHETDSVAAVADKLPTRNGTSLN